MGDIWVRSGVGRSLGDGGLTLMGDLHDGP